MRAKTFLITAASGLLVNIFLGGPAWALEERRELAADRYERIARETRLSAGRPVVVYCDADDVAVDGFCDGANQTGLAQYPRSVDFVGVPERGLREIHLQHAMIKDATARAAGSSCHARVVHPEQVLRVDAHIICRRASEKRG